MGELINSLMKNDTKIIAGIIILLVVMIINLFCKTVKQQKKIESTIRQRNDYSASAVKHAFWFMEFRKVVTLRHKGKTWEEIKKANEEENLFGAPTPARAMQIWNTVSARTKALDDSFYQIFMNGDLASQKLFALVAVMANDMLFAEFVYEIIREKMIIGINEYSPSDIRLFFKHKQEQSEKAAMGSGHPVQA